jgi:hypothetical protein
VSHLRGKFARLVALLALIAGLIGAAVPGSAATPAASPAETHHMAMDCDHESRQTAPAHHFPGTDDCCVANVCAMSLALPATSTGMALPAFAGQPDYDLPVLHPPAGIVTAPIPHPPKRLA